MNAPTWEIADYVSESSDQMFTTIDVRNRINKYNSEIHGDENDINDFCNDIIKDGDNVAAKYEENMKVRVLLVQMIKTRRSFMKKRMLKMRIRVLKTTKRRTSKIKKRRTSKLKRRES